MNPLAALRLACRSLLRNKVRAFLTMLGIVIGIASVIAMVAIGQGASAQVQSQISTMGQNLLTVMAGSASSGGSSWGSGTATTLTPEDADAIVKDVPAISGATPLLRLRTQVVAAGRNWVPHRVLGAGPAFLEVRDWALDEGEWADGDAEG